MSSTRTGQNIDPQPIPDAEARTVPRDKTAATRLSPDAVSYTHLDVYKRQSVTLALVRTSILQFSLI